MNEHFQGKHEDKAKECCTLLTKKDKPFCLNALDTNSAVNENITGLMPSRSILFLESTCIPAAASGGDGDGTMGWINNAKAEHGRQYKCAHVANKVNKWHTKASYNCIQTITGE